MRDRLLYRVTVAIVAIGVLVSAIVLWVSSTMVVRSFARGYALEIAGVYHSFERLSDALDGASEVIDAAYRKFDPVVYLAGEKSSQSTPLPMPRTMRHWSRMVAREGITATFVEVGGKEVVELTGGSGSVRMGLDGEVVAQRLRRLFFLLLFLGVILLLLATICAFLIARRSLRPLEQLARGELPTNGDESIQRIVATYRALAIERSVEEQRAVQEQLAARQEAEVARIAADFIDRLPAVKEPIGDSEVSHQLRRWKEEMEGIDVEGSERVRLRLSAYLDLYEPPKEPLRRPVRIAALVEGLGVEVEIDEEAVELVCDPALLFALLRNLIHIRGAAPPLVVQRAAGHVRFVAKGPHRSFSRSERLSILRPLSSRGDGLFALAACRVADQLGARLFVEEGGECVAEVSIV